MLRGTNLLIWSLFWNREVHAISLIIIIVGVVITITFIRGVVTTTIIVIFDDLPHLKNSFSV